MSGFRDKDSKLHQMIHEDFGDDSGAYLPTLQRLREWDAPSPDEAMRTRLHAAIDNEVQAQTTSAAFSQMLSWPLLILRSQVRVVHSEIWLASLLLIAIGTGVTLASRGDEPLSTLPLVVLAPIVSVFAVALLYDERAIKMLELESTTAVSARLLVLARLTLVFGFNLLLMFAGSLCLSLLRDDLSLWPLVMSWFAPMTFLSALAFFASVAFTDALVGGFLGLALWMIHVVLRYTSADNPLVLALSAPGLSAQENRPLLFLTALVLTAAALWMVGHERSQYGGVN